MQDVLEAATEAEERPAASQHDTGLFTQPSKRVPTSLISAPT